MFALFAGAEFYPSGGWADFVCFFDSIEAFEKSKPDALQYVWAHLVDLREGKIVWDQYNGDEAKSWHRGVE